MARFQFSLWTLMLVITVACIFLFLMMSFGDFVEILIASIVWCIIPTPFVILVIFARGELQAFAIGALIPWFTFVVLRLPASVSYFASTLWLLPLCTICGALAAATRRWLKTNLRE